MKSGILCKEANQTETGVLCKVSQEPCAFQKYCGMISEYINTLGAKECVNNPKNKPGIVTESKLSSYTSPGV